MNLQQTIEELETKAAEYTQAANSLRALLPYENVNGSSQNKAKLNGSSNGSINGSANGNYNGKVKSKLGAKSESSTQSAKQATAKTSRGQKASRKRAPVSPETRAKISASHKARRQQQENNA